MVKRARNPRHKSVGDKIGASVLALAACVGLGGLITYKVDKTSNSLKNQQLAINKQYAALQAEQKKLDAYRAQLVAASKAASKTKPVVVTVVKRVPSTTVTTVTKAS